jgi:hypothetical protein
MGRVLGCLAVSVVLGLTGAAEAGKGKVKFHPDWERHPATRYGALSAPACLEELTRRDVVFEAVADAPGVLAPVRLPEGVGGVAYHTEASAHARTTNPYDVFDCRLALALSDFSKILQAHDIDEVLMFSAWRPARSRRPPPETSRPVATRHPGGLAIDVFRFGKRLETGKTTKRWLDVKRDFRGIVGAPVCGPGAPARRRPEARELASIVCEAADRHLFTTVLTPNYDRAHHNHFHLEVTPSVKWYLVR